MDRLTKTHELYREITNTLIKKKISVSAMESCTCGLFASFISDTQGSSAVLGGSLITYSNASKIQMGVDKRIIDEYGVYSVQTAQEMARAVNVLFPADLSVGITGSLSNVDENNMDSVAGEVYYGILFRGEYHIGKILLKEKGRFESKLEVLEVIGRKLLEIV